jgi:sulfur relay (sulfurtransferase) DsrF/TusC family protein
MVKSLLVITHTGPHGTMDGFEQLRMAKLFKRAGECAVNVVLVDDGVYYALKNQNSEDLGIPPYEVVLMHVAQMMKIQPIYIVKESLQERGLNESSLDESLGYKLIGFSEMEGLLQEASVISVG